MTAQVVFRAAQLVSVATGGHRSSEWCKGKRALLVSGVGHAASFRNTAEELGVRVIDEVAYPDHYTYSRTTSERSGNAPSSARQKSC